jgi:hypothetical protein
MMPEWLVFAGSALVAGLGILFGYRTFRLSQLQIAKEKAEADALKKAELGANFYSLGASVQRLKIFNKGKATAHNVRIDFPDDIDCIQQDDIEAKFPLETLPVHASVELRVWRHLGMTRTKYQVQLTWDDDFKKNNTVVLHPTL